MNPVQPRRHYVANDDRLPREVPDEVLHQLFVAIGDHRRDRTIFTLMLHAGLRVGEVVNLRAPIFLKVDRPSRLRVHGKGQRERIVYLSDHNHPSLARLLDQPNRLPRIARVSQSARATDHGDRAFNCNWRNIASRPASGSPAINYATPLPAT